MQRAVRQLSCDDYCEELLKCRSIHHNILRLFKSPSRIMADYSYVCYQNMLQNLFASC